MLHLRRYFFVCSARLVMLLGPNIKHVKGQEPFVSFTARFVDTRARCL